MLLGENGSLDMRHGYAAARLVLIASAGKHPFDAFFGKTTAADEAAGELLMSAKRGLVDSAGDCVENFHSFRCVGVWVCGCVCVFELVLTL